MPPPFLWAMAFLDEGNSGGTCGHGNTSYGTPWSPSSPSQMLAQLPPISLALIPATRVPSTFHGTGDGLLGAWRRLWQCWHSWSHSREWLHHWLCHHWINHSWTSHLAAYAMANWSRGISHGRVVNSLFDKGRENTLVYLPTKKGGSIYDFWFLEGCKSPFFLLSSTNFWELSK